MISTALAIALGVLAAAGGFLRLHKVLTVFALDPLELGRALDKTASEDDVRRLGQLVRAEGAGHAADLIDAVLEPAGARRTAAVNEVLADLASELEWGADLPRGCAKIAFLGALCLVIVGVLGGRASVEVSISVMAWGAFGATASLLAGREARARASEQRARIDRFVGLALAAADRVTGRPSMSSGGVDSEPTDV